MKRSEELKLQRSAKAKKMQDLLDKAKNDNKRALTTEEQAAWDALDAEVRTLTTQIATAERAEEIAGYIGTRQQSTRQDLDGDDAAANHQHQRGGSGQAPHQGRQTAPYSVGKAMREFFGRGVEGLSGLEKEQHDELARNISSEGLLVPFENHHLRDQNTTSNATSVDVVIDPNLSILGKQPLYAQMGLTVLPGLTGTFKIGKKTADVAEKVAEKTALSQTANVPSFVTMSPERYGITDIFTKELLAQENPAVHAAIIADMVNGCDRKITADVYTVALAAATAVSAGALTVAGFNALMAAVDEDGAFAMSRTSFFEAKGVKVDTGSGKFLVAPSAVNGVGASHDGVKVCYSTLFADGTDQQYAIYGAWKEMNLGFWGALEILKNPYTYQKQGQIELTVNRLANIKSRNDAAFVKTADLDAAE